MSNNYNHNYGGHYNGNGNGQQQQQQHPYYYQHQQQQQQQYQPQHPQIDPATNNTTDLPKKSLTPGLPRAQQPGATAHSNHVHGYIPQEGPKKKLGGAAAAPAEPVTPSFSWMTLSHKPIAKELAIYIHTAEALQRMHGNRLQQWQINILRKAWEVHYDHCRAYWAALDKILKSYLSKHMDIPAEMTADRDDVLFYGALIQSLLEENEGQLDILDELVGYLHNHRTTLKNVCNLHKERFTPLFQAFCTPDEMVTMVQKTLSTRVKQCDGAWMFHHGVDGLLKQIFQNQDARNAQSWVNVFQNLEQAYHRKYVEPLRALQENLQPFVVFD